MNTVYIAITNDLNYLAHYGVPGQEWYVNKAERYQNHAQYAKGHPKYNDDLKKQMKALRASNKFHDYIDINKQVVDKFANKAASSLNTRRRVKAAVKEAKAEGRSKEEIKDIKRAKKGTFRDLYGSSYGTYRSFWRTINPYNHLENYLDTRFGENQAFMDLGLSKGWGKTRQGLNKVEYYIRNPEKCNKKLDSFVGKVRNSKPYRAFLMDYDRAVNRGFYETAYDRTIQRAFEMYGMTPEQSSINRSVV